jgi:magnesium transporter
MPHPLFGPEIRMMLMDNNTKAMKAFVESLNPRTIAETLTDDDLTVEQLWQVLQSAEVRRQALVFEYFPIELQVKLAVGAGRPQMAKLIELMSHDDRVDLLRRLPEQTTEALIRLVDEVDRRDIANLFRYTENSVGAIMTTDYAWLPAGLNAGQAIDRLRQQAPDRETIYYIYVLNETTRKLMGILSLRALVLADRQTPVRQLMESSDLKLLKASDDRERAAEALAKYDLLAVPVVDDDGRLVGIVTHDDVIDVITEEATEDLQKQGAVGPLREAYLEAPLFKLWYSRGIWLAMLFVLQMATINVMGFFEGAMKELIILAVFIPVCLSVGGNAGSQAGAVITRALALQQVTNRDWWRVFSRELLLGLGLGAMVGTLGWLRTYLFTSSSDLGETSLMSLSLVIGFSIAFICTWGTLIGSLLPILCKRLGLDPAIASIPFIATFCDVFGIIIYFSVAKQVLL